MHISVTRVKINVEKVGMSVQLYKVFSLLI